MSRDPKYCRENALRSAERAPVRTPEPKLQLIELCKSYLTRSIKLERFMALWPWTVHSQSRRVGDTPALHRMGLEHLENANRQVAESERILAEWSALIDRMQGEGRDVTVACDLLRTLKGNLETRRSSRDLIRQTVVEGASRLHE